MPKVLVALLLATLCASCHTTAASSGERTSAEAGVHRAHDAYVDAINSNDVERMLATLTDDVVFLAPNTPVMVGKDALRPWLEGYVEAFETHYDKPVRELVVCGDHAFERYDWASTDRPRAGGDVVRDSGWGLVVYRREPDGVWRVARDAWGYDHPPR